MIIGLTGSVGSGKSTAATLLQDLFGAKVVDADAVVHRLQEPQAEGFRRIISEFGTRFIASDGRLDRKALAGQVFSDEGELQKLNSVLHPLVWDELRSELKGLAGQDLVVLMVPLLFETGMDSLADITLLVTIDEAVRARRLRERNGWTEAEVNRRLAAQMPEAEKIQRADFVVHNNGSLQDLQEELKAVLPLMQAENKFRVVPDA